LCVAKGHPAALTNLGALYHNGKAPGCKGKRDEARAARLYRAAAAEADAPSSLSGLAREGGDIGDPQGCAAAAFNLGVLYREGSGAFPPDDVASGFERDLSESTKWLRKARKLGLRGGVRRRLAWRSLNRAAAAALSVWGLAGCALAFQHWTLARVWGARTSAAIAIGFGLLGVVAAFAASRLKPVTASQRQD